MSQQVQELIDKIKKEGIQEAEQKALELQEDAQKKADAIIAEAKKKADGIIHGAQRESDQLKETTRTALEQASRDTLLNLRRSIQQMLNRIVSANVRGSLPAEEWAGIIGKVIAAYARETDTPGAIVTLSGEDLAKIKDGVLAALKEQFKKPVTFQAGADVKAGFTVSFDGGKSCFDFTDASLVAYISDYLNKDVSALLQETTASK